MHFSFITILSVKLTPEFTIERIKNSCATATAYNIEILTYSYSPNTDPTTQYGAEHFSFQFTERVARV